MDGLSVLSMAQSLHLADSVYSRVSKLLPPSKPIEKLPLFYSQPSEEFCFGMPIIVKIELGEKF
jgi:hypothetical protein